MKDEIHSYSIFSDMVRSLNEEQHIIFDYILYKKWMNTNESLSIFLTSGAAKGKTFTLMIIILGLLQFYFEQNKDLDPSK